MEKLTEESAHHRLDPRFVALLEPYWNRALSGMGNAQPKPEIARLESAEALAAAMHLLTPEAQARAKATIRNLRKAAS